MNPRTLISSSSNSQIKNITLLQKKAKARRKQGLFVVEGIKMFEEAKDSKLLVNAYVSESFYRERAEAEVSELLDGLEYNLVTDAIFNQIADTMTPQGILGIVKRPIYTLKQMLEHRDAFVLLLEDIRDPGNLGTIIRTAEAAGVMGIILNSSCADILQPKVVRSTMGSIYRVPYYEVEDFTGFLLKLKEEGFELYAAHLSGLSYDAEGDFLGRTGLLIGNEAGGLSEEAIEIADHLVRIPMMGKVESLNASIAAAILMYEVVRQRRTTIVDK